MQRLDFMHPGEGDVIIAPASVDRDRDLVVGGAVERPVVDGSEALDDIDRVDLTLAGEVDQRHAVPTLRFDGCWKRTRLEATDATALLRESDQATRESLGRSNITLRLLGLQADHHDL